MTLSPMRGSADGVKSFASGFREDLLGFGITEKLADVGYGISFQPVSTICL
jgi:hypothetical protein